MISVKKLRANLIRFTKIVKKKKEDIFKSLSRDFFEFERILHGIEELPSILHKKGPFFLYRISQLIIPNG